MASTAAILIGVYGLFRGLLAVLAGIAFAIGGSIISAAGEATGAADGLGALGGLVVVIGVVMLLAGLVMWASSIGLFLEKGWAPLLTAITFGVLAVIGLVSVVQGALGIVTILMLVLDAVAAGWGAMNAPQIPVGNGKQQPQAV